MGDNDISYLYEPSGSELHWDGLKKARATGEQTSLSSPGSVSRPSGGGMQGTAPVRHVPRQATRPPTHEELLAQAMAMLESHKSQAAAQEGTSLVQHNEAGQPLPEWLTREMGRR